MAFVLIIFCWQTKYKAISFQEFKWAIFHPIAAIKVKQITKKCNKIYFNPNLKLQLDSFESGGKLDAFRHIFYMAAYAQKIKIKKLRKLGIAHEKGNYKQFLKGSLENGELPDSISTVMDLNNNEIAFALQTKFKYLPLIELQNNVIKLINKNGAFVILRNELGEFIDCEGTKIIYKKEWHINKCLIKPKFNLHEL
ncbi:MAG: hypothetical protein LCH32_07755 [Bacteroidetes bacterium]|nr:hypothetical protein [Bacteroidota bacterium]